VTRFSYYPGCSLAGSAREYDRSIREAGALLDIELEELPDWNCCGASSAHMTDRRLAIDLSARNLELAEEAGMDVLVPCAACFQRLRKADLVLRQDPRQWARGEKYDPDFEIIHMTTLLSGPEMLDRMRGLVVRELTGLKLACYYGCLSLRPPAVTGAVEYEHPDGLDRIARTLGAEPLSWSHKTECCGGSLTMARPEIVRDLVGDIVSAARRAGAQALVTDCPMCHSNLESRQVALKAEEDADSIMPVFFGTELIVMALADQSDEKRWKKHLLDPRPVLARMER